MDIPPLQNSRVDVTSMPLQELASNKHVPQAQKVKAVSQAFESLLLRQILEETQKPVFTSSLVGNSTTDGIYRSLVVNQLADSIAKSGSLGLGKSISAQLSPHTGAAQQAPGGAATPLHQLPHYKNLTSPAIPASKETHAHD